MKCRRRKSLFLLIIAFVCSLAILVPDVADARGFRGGRSFGRSSSWGRSRSRSYSSRRSSWGRRSSGRKVSKADRKLARRAKSQGTSFSNRKSAAQSFKKKYGGQYKSKYASKPGTRPKHIPETFKKDGKTYNITYNSSRGGYGYMQNGNWVMYNMMADAAMMNMMMRHRGYYYGPAVYSRGGSCFGTFIVIALIVGAVFVIQKARTRGQFQ